MDFSRRARLDRIFHDSLRGQASNPRNGALFIEAICIQDEPAACIHKIVSSSGGLLSLQAAMRQDLSIPFLNSKATGLISYLKNIELKDIGGGQILQHVLQRIVEPPIFWSAFANAFRSRQLQEPAQACFAWLLLQLLSLPGEGAGPYRGLSEDSVITDLLLKSSDSETRSMGHKIKLIASTCGSGLIVDGDYHPGGRHDNDFIDFHQIAILPTIDEITSKEPPYLRTSHELMNQTSQDTRIPSYLDNSFRLLREDMLYETKDELSIALGQKNRRHRGDVIEGFKLVDMHYGTDDRRVRWGFQLECLHDLWQLKKIKPGLRQKHLTSNPRIVPHQSVTCLLVDGSVVAFPTIHRDVDLLAKKPPILVIQLDGEASTKKALFALRGGCTIKLIFINTPMFAYEPILKALKSTKTLPLTEELVFWTDSSTLSRPSFCPTRVMENLQGDPTRNLQEMLGTSRPIVLDSSQFRSLVSALSQRVSLIQGPPGTGKSFIGALIAKVLHDSTKQTVLLVCYTNHALDQFLEDLLDIGIPKSDIIRLGSKSTARTEELTLHKQLRAGPKFGRAQWNTINFKKLSASTALTELKNAFTGYQTSFRNKFLAEFLEFEEPDYYDAVRVPNQSEAGMTFVDSRGNAVRPDYLLDRWIHGKDAGIFNQEENILNGSDIWRMSHHERNTQLAHWRERILEDHISATVTAGAKYNKHQSDVERMYDENVGALLRSKRIIACTTTAAAKYSESIQSASPGILLVEEAGEILESHIITALGPKTEQLILIGDHKQLRPKVNNYALTVEKGEGYDLNRSLFERLVLAGYPHETLNKQHRMRPEIAALVRNLTYPELVNADGTKGRPNVRGLQDNIIFISHHHPEDDTLEVIDRRDIGSQSSKQNSHEAAMVLKIVRYLAQQGYGTEKLVILTPYLAQLHKLQEDLKNAGDDPVLSDLDSHDLVRAGLMPAATAQAAKKPIRLSTIDNYQGEESDIVIVSLTRSNSTNDIGFMYAPERLNVLLSRARLGLIMIGNLDTFLHARRAEGKELWGRFIELLKQGKHIHDGFPVQCERHPDRRATLSQPIHFDEQCPDGGCQKPCGVILSCGVHPCPSKCHQISDHSKMPCETAIKTKCVSGHMQNWKCREGVPLSCARCDRQAKLAEIKRNADLEQQRKRDAEQAEHQREIEKIEAQMAEEQEAQRDLVLGKERKNALEQKKRDLEATKKRTKVKASKPISTLEPTTPGSSNASACDTPSSSNAGADEGMPPDLTESLLTKAKQSGSTIHSDAQREWQRQKDVEGANNEHIDAIMGMVGLEDVKAQVLRIKSKIETSKRQGTSVRKERFNIVLLGNPGTGKTTIARHYARFLASIEVLPGDEFVEATGAGLANDGVPGTKKLIESVLKAGGGAIFIDEAYQLKSEHNFQGSQVLDYLLAEMENNIGKLIFILAGYNRQMEKFFEHNPGLGSRVPHQLQFTDYTDNELLLMLEMQIEKKWNGRMKVKDGARGLYSRVAMRRLGRGRGKEGFGNARALENVFQTITDRQSDRLSRQRAKGLRPDDLTLLREDLIGPDPSAAIVESKAWKKLQGLIGLASVKQSVQNLIDRIATNYRRELQEKEPIVEPLNRVFLGSPGTGKTTVANLYGQILADIGILSNGEVVMKNPADFIGNVLGASEVNTKAILATTVGKVLVIDEAYMLYGASSGGGKQNDPFKTAVIDTIVAEVQNVAGEDRCVLLLGYETQMVEMFQNVNPGLSRRFAIENAFRFEDFTNPQLLDILNLKLKQQDLQATDAAKTIAIEVLDKARNRPNFGNGGEVENQLGIAKGRFQSRHAYLPPKDRPADVIFEPQDFDPDFDRGARGADNLKKLFEDVIGCEDIVERLEEYQNMARIMRAQGKDPRDVIPTNFVFKGPPGTGKTTTARKMGQVYYDMGFIASAKVTECSASELVGQYVGHTGPKTKQVFERALGQVLFIDEAYRLGEGQFAKEAMDEVVSILTLPAYKGKIVVILAGYDQDMNNLLSVNPGLSSRFPDEIVFKNMEPTRCLELLCKRLQKQGVTTNELEDPSSQGHQDMLDIIQNLSELPSWGNARDIDTLSKHVMRLVYKHVKLDAVEAGLQLSMGDVIASAEDMLKERSKRAFNTISRVQPVLPPPTSGPPSVDTSTRQSTRPELPKSFKEKPAPLQEEDDFDDLDDFEDMFDSLEIMGHFDGMQRDAGVSDATWKQLGAAKKDAADAEKKANEDLRTLEDAAKEAEQEERRQVTVAKELVLTAEQARDAAVKVELMRQLEQQRLVEITARAERERRAAELAARREKEEQDRRREAAAQAKLRIMGVCVAGFKWIKMGDGYRCAGGSHFVSSAQLGM